MSNQASGLDVAKEVSAATEHYNEIYDVFASNFIFFERSLTEWIDEMNIEIPKEVGPKELQALSLELARKLQTATSYYNVSSAIYDALTSGSSAKKSQVIASLVERYSKEKKTRPAATVIERMADTLLKELGTDRTAARIIRDFWKDRKATLIEIRKTLEQVAISINVQLKYLEQEII